ncbi:MAG: penicillin acylase family protein [Desulfococcaceae bacterium]|jgi:penicillin amidase|nr:penicillin acylase family protein [Desulfococcaceae bacterium]
MFRLRKNFVRPVPFFLLMLFLICGCSGDSDEPRTTVETKRDDKGVWFITGTEDATVYNIFEAQGYAVATDRLWQAETFRRRAAGRLAEVLGPDFLQSDVYMRITGYTQAELEKGFAELDAETRSMIEGYVAGFNRRIAEVRADNALLPFEFKAAGFSPEDWTVYDVLAWAATMLRNFDPEGGPVKASGQIDNAALVAELTAKYGTAQGMAMFNDLRWVNDPRAQTYIHETEVLTARSGLPAENRKKAVADLQKASEQIRETEKMIAASLKKINADVRMGSYAWVVDGSRTDTGNPILYSGPQMDFYTPSIILEGSIRAGGLHISGMGIAGLPGIVIGRTPHHTWSMQVGHAHTTDYYIENPSDVRMDRVETIKVAGSDDISLPVFESVHGPVIHPMPYPAVSGAADTPIISWKYSHRGYEFQTIGAYLKMAKAQNMDEFGAAVDGIAVSQHFCYADREGNIAYWMSGRDPVRPEGEYRFPQGFLPDVPVAEWDAAVVRPRSSDRNTSKGYYTGWNNKSSAAYDNSYNNLFYFFGPAHRSHVLEEYFVSHEKVGFEDIRDLALNIAATDSFGLDTENATGAGGNPWAFVSGIFSAAVQNNPTAEREAALAIMEGWDGHFVDGGPAQWAAGKDRADAWMLSDVWILETLRLIFLDELGQETFEKQPSSVLFNVMLHAFSGENSGIINHYNWFQNTADENAPQTSSDIIVTALDNALAGLGNRPWGTDKRGETVYKHDMIGQVHAMPFASRSTYAHCVEMGSSGPVRIESMIPLGESGFIGMDAEGKPVFDDHFFSMANVFDTFVYREFPLFD